MKHIVIAIMACLMFSCIPAKAQIPEVYIKQGLDTSINQDTDIVTFSQAPSKIKKLRVRVNRISGTIAANSYVILQGYMEGTEWENIGHVKGDSMTVANQATTYKDYPITSTDYTSYRALYITPASTQRSVLRFSWLRRPDE